MCLGLCALLSCTATSNLQVWTLDLVQCVTPMLVKKAHDNLVSKVILSDVVAAIRQDSNVCEFVESTLHETTQWSHHQSQLSFNHKRIYYNAVTKSLLYCSYQPGLQRT